MEKAPGFYLEDSDCDSESESEIKEPVKPNTKRLTEEAKDFLANFGKGAEKVGEETPISKGPDPTKGGKPSDSEDAYQRAFYEEMKALYRKYFQGMREHEPTEWESLLSEKAKERMTRLKGWEDKGKYGMPISEIRAYWVRVSPVFEKPVTTIEEVYDLLNQTDKVTRKKGILNYWFALDQSSDKKEKMGLHPHIHLLLIRDMDDPIRTEPARFIKGIKNTYSRIGDPSSKGFINIKCLRAEDIPQRIKYIKGEKASDKMKIEKIAEEWRKKLDIEDYFTDDLEIQKE